jgi:membrane protease YdiL (CAAX protease family)
VQTLFLALLLAPILALLLPRLQARLSASFLKKPGLVWALPPFLTAIFALAALEAGAFSLTLTLLVLAYTFLPTALAFIRQDFLAILALWLPLEFAAGQTLVPRSAQGFLHSVAYGIAILLALALFRLFRDLPGMKYNLPKTARDYWLPFAAFAISAPILAGLGVAIGFIPPPHLPTQSAGRMAGAAGIIFAGTALPEEILFRALIQNLIVRSLGRNFRTLFLAAFIFGSAHLDNGPQPLPNWRYMILATVAGIAYGKVFEMADTVLSSALLHTLVDWTKHFFF